MRELDHVLLASKATTPSKEVSTVHQSQRVSELLQTTLQRLRTLKFALKEPTLLGEWRLVKPVLMDISAQREAERQLLG